MKTRLGTFVCVVGNIVGPVHCCIQLTRVLYEVHSTLVAAQHAEVGIVYV